MTTTQTETIHFIDTKLIDVPDFNSRMSWDEDRMKQLIAEIEADGQQQPIQVVEAPDGRYTLVYGSRRTEACKKLDRPVKATVVPMGLPKKEQAFRNAIENTQREDLTTFELARTFAHMRELEVPIQETADRLGFTKGYVSTLVQCYTKLADPVKEAWERSSVIGAERNPGKLTAREQAELAVCNVSFLYRDILKAGDDAKQVEKFEATVAAVMKQNEAAAEGEEGDAPQSGSGGRRSAGGGSGVTTYKVTAEKLANTKDALKKLGDDGKLAFLAVRYLVGEIKSIKGVIDAPAEPVKVAKGKGKAKNGVKQATA